MAKKKKSTRQGTTGPTNSRSAKGSARRKSAQKAGYRSAFEHDVAKELERNGIEFDYEPEEEKLEWVPPAKTYLPDFVLENGIVVETKGRLTQHDRQKLVQVRDQHPYLDLRIVFASDNKLTARSKTRYSEWAEKNGFDYAIGNIPPEWADEE